MNAMNALSGNNDCSALQHIAHNPHAKCLVALSSGPQDLLETYLHLFCVSLCHVLHCQDSAWLSYTGNVLLAFKGRPGQTPVGSCKPHEGLGKILNEDRENHAMKCSMLHCLCSKFCIFGSLVARIGTLVLLCVNVGSSTSTGNGTEPETYRLTDAFSFRQPVLFSCFVTKASHFIQVGP